MLKMIISGCGGHMGRTLARIAGNDEAVEIIAGFDISSSGDSPFPVYTNPLDYNGSADIVVDFSNAAALDGILSYCTREKKPLVLCTTGYSSDQENKIRKTSEIIPIFKSGNMSLGVNVITDLTRRACAALDGAYDVEIVESHHRRKVDAPSGTALMLAEAAASSLPYKAEYVYDRQSRRKPRGEHEIGISSIRGGTIVGEHTVIFAGLDEVIEIKHTAYSRDIFAVGAIKAAKFLVAVGKSGMYDMQDMLNKK